MPKEKEERAQLGKFTGLRREYRKFKADLSHIIQQQDRCGYVIQAADACKDVLIHQYNALSGVSRRTFSTDFNNYKVPMAAAMNSKSIVTRIATQSTKWLCDNIGNDWNDYAKRGLDKDQWEAQIAEERCEWLLHHHRNILKRLTDAIWGDDIKATGSPYIDALRPIILSKVNNDLLAGKYHTDTWLTEPHTQPLVITLATFFFKFEGVVDPQSLNLCEDLDLAHEMAKSAAGTTIWQLDSHLDEVFDSQIKLWGSIEQFFRYYRSTLLTKMVDTMAEQDTDDRNEWQQCKQQLAKLRHETKYINLEDIYATIRTAEDEIIKRRSSLAAKETRAKEASAFQASTGANPPPPTAQPSFQAQLDEIKAMLTNRDQRGPKGGKGQHRGSKKREETRTGKGGKQPDGSVNYTYPKCDTCGRHHKGGTAACVHNRDIAKELRDAQSNVQRLQHLQKITGPKEKKAEHTTTQADTGPTPTEQRLAAAGKRVVISELPEQITEHCPMPQNPPPLQVSVFDPDTQQHPTDAIHAYGAALDVTAAPPAEGPCVDSATQSGVTNSERSIISLDGVSYRLTGIEGTATTAKGCSIGFTTVADDGTPLLFSTPNSLYSPTARENLLSLAQILQAGHRVQFKTGLPHDPQYGGYIQTKQGQRITLIFRDNLWRLPIWAPATQATHRQRKLRPAVPSEFKSLLTNNPYAALMTLTDSQDRKVEETVHAFHLRTRTAPELLTLSQQMQLVCNRWGHPGRTKHMENFKYYKGKGFPQGFPTLLKQWSCPICINMKSARQYRVAKKPTATPNTGFDTESDTESDDDGSSSPSSASTALHSQVNQTTIPRDRYHIDFGYSIAIGIRKEKYFLLIRLEEQDFLWALPTATRANPVALLQDFAALTGVIPSAVQCDNEFAENSAVQAWCRHNGAVICPTPAYNHTMNGRIEGAVRISKDHLRCLIKTANAPFRFWPFALKHFLRTYAWWARKHKPPPWVRMPASCQIYRDRDRDLKVWGCLVTGRIPTEHPIVQVDKTNADRSLQGVFLGFHDTTPTFWMYSLKLQRVVRLCDPIFSEAALPFADPSVILNREELTDAMVRRMHQQDIFLPPEEHPTATVPSNSGEPASTGTLLSGESLSTGTIHPEDPHSTGTSASGELHSTRTTSSGEPLSTGTSTSGELHSTRTISSGEPLSTGTLTSGEFHSTRTSSSGEPCSTGTTVQRAPTSGESSSIDTQLLNDALSQNNTQPRSSPTLTYPDDTAASINGKQVVINTTPTTAPTSPRPNTRLRAATSLRQGEAPETERPSSQISIPPPPARLTTPSTIDTVGNRMRQALRNNYDISSLKDGRLANILVDAKFVTQLPPDWWKDPRTQQFTSATVQATRAWSTKGWHFLDCHVLKPETAAHEIIQLPISERNGHYPWNLRSLLNINYDNPIRLHDIGITDDRIGAVHQALMTVWEPVRLPPRGPTTLRPSGDNQSPSRADIFIPSLSTPPPGPFTEDQLNVIWALHAETLSPRTDWETLADLDCLEPDPPHRRRAMQNARLKPFWLGAEEKEMQGLWNKGCFERVQRTSLPAGTRVFSSRFHYKIKRYSATSALKSLKVRLVVQGHRMQEGRDFDQAFAPVPRSAVGRTMMAIAAANNMHLHAMDVAQAFIQASWSDLPEDTRTIYITPPEGVDENPDVVYRVVRPLYGIPSSARALHFTLVRWFREQGFTQAGFEESVFIRKAGGRYKEDIYVSSHIDDLLTACKDPATLALFKQDFLAAFEGTDDGPVEDYLGCEVVRDWKAGSLTLRQCGYIQRVLRVCGAENYAPVDTPLKPGKRLSRRDCPSSIDPAVQRRYRMIIGYIGFLVQMSRPDLAFAYTELSKFLSCPGTTHLEQAERTLAYLNGTQTMGITYSRPKFSNKVNLLEAWVDSDYAADPDTRRSVSGYVIVLNNGPVAWKSKRQSCVTLSSAEAEFVAASQCGVECLYLRALLRGFNYNQLYPTTLWEDNEAAIAMSANPVAPDKSRHIDTRYFFLRDMDRAHVIKLRHVPGTENIADALTKSLPAVTFRKHFQLLMGNDRENLMARTYKQKTTSAPLLPPSLPPSASRRPCQGFAEAMGWGPEEDHTLFSSQLIHGSAPYVAVAA